MDSFRHLKGYIVSPLNKHENANLKMILDLFTQKHVLRLVPGFVGLGHKYAREYENAVQILACT